MHHAGNQNRRAISLFLLTTLLTSSVFYFLIIHSGKLGNVFGIYVTGLMWCPGLSAIFTCKLLKRKVATLGWQWGKSKYQLWSYAIPFLYTLITYSITWLTGLGGFFSHDFAKEISTTYGWEQLPAVAVVFLYIILMGFYGIAGKDFLLREYDYI